MILHNVQPPGWIVSSEWVNSRKILLCIMWYVCFLVCIILMFMEECICLVSLLLKIRLTLRPQSLLPGIILFYYDITMECHSYSYSSRTRRLDGNGVKQNFHCLPDAPLYFEYTEIKIVGVDGLLRLDERRRCLLG